LIEVRTHFFKTLRNAASNLDIQKEGW
jgi:hypothetical protein